MKYSLLFSILSTCLITITPIKSVDDYGLSYFTFDNDTLTASCTKPKPLVFNLMFDFLQMIQAESKNPMQQCVLDKKGPGFTTPPSIGRNIFAVTTILYNTYARYSRAAMPATTYNTWTRMSTAPQNVPNCVYIYGFYHIANFLIPERLTNYSFKSSYERNYNCNLSEVSAQAGSELGLVQRDIEQLKAQLKVDGFNQDGCFADTTNFRTINPPCLLDNRSTIETCRNFTQTYNTIWNYGEFQKTGYVNSPRTTVLSQALKCRPFALGKLYDYLAPPYFEAPAFENGTMMNLTAQFRESINIQQSLDADNDKPKLIVEFWAGGKGTTATPGHWQSISLNIIRRRCYDNDEALKLLFAVSAATYDAGIAAWQNKRLYSSVRPVTYIPTQFMNDNFTKQFVGMYCDFQNIEGWQWRPYQEDHVMTPEFPEYISGHSTFSRAASYVLEMFTGSPNVPGNLSVTIKVGQSLFQPRCNQSDASCYRNCSVNSSQNSENNFLPKVDVTLGPWRFYRDIADEASMSRIYGGIHVRSGDIQGRLIGQKVGEAVWLKVAALFNDTMPSENTAKRLDFQVLFYVIGLCFYFLFY